MLCLWFSFDNLCIVSVFVLVAKSCLVVSGGLSLALMSVDNVTSLPCR